MASEKLVFKDIDSLDLLLATKSILGSSFVINKKSESIEYKNLLSLLEIEVSNNSGDVYNEIDLALHSSSDDSVVDSKWLAHIYSSLSNPIANNFHIIDLMKRAYGLLNSSAPHKYPTPNSIAEEKNINLGNLKILIKESKKLVCDEFFLKSLSNLNCKIEIILIGEKISNSHIREAESTIKIHDFREELAISQIARLMYLSDICILEPSTASLLASGYGTLTICVASKNRVNNLLLPYGQGNLIIESCSETASGLDLCPEIIKQIIKTAPNTPTSEEWKNFGESLIESHIQKYRLFLTTLVESDISEGKKLEQSLFPLLFQGTEFNDLLKMSHEISLSNNIDNEFAYPFWASPIHKDTINYLTKDIDALEQFSQLCLFAKNYCLQSTIGSNAVSLENVRNSSKKLEECDELFRSLALVNPLINYYFIYLSNLQKLIPASGLSALSLKMADTYQFIANITIKHLEVIAEVLALVKEQEKEFLNLVKE
ncbi:MAG: hypothetical protein M9962_02210 [Oligoflexia bacterium]|nr:hypothetical protein [Oligoflexia bacterium]